MTLWAKNIRLKPELRESSIAVLSFAPAGWGEDMPVPLIRPGLAAAALLLCSCANYDLDKDRRADFQRSSEGSIAQAQESALQDKPAPAEHGAPAGVLVQPEWGKAIQAPLEAGLQAYHRQEEHGQRDRPSRSEARTGGSLNEL